MYFMSSKLYIEGYLYYYDHLVATSLTTKGRSWHVHWRCPPSRVVLVDLKGLLAIITMMEKHLLSSSATAVVICVLNATGSSTCAGGPGTTPDM